MMQYMSMWAAPALLEEHAAIPEAPPRACLLAGPVWSSLQMSFEHMLQSANSNEEKNDMKLL